MITSSIQANQFPKDSDKRIVFQHISATAGLVIIAVIAYLSFYAPVLYSDDWSLMIGRWYFDNLQWFDLSEQRPLLKICLVILYGIFGLNINAFYIVLWTLTVLNAIQIYLLLLRFIPKNAIIAFSIAAIILIYPAEFTHMWLTMIQVRTVVFLTLLYAHLLLIYADTGRRIALWGALFCFVIPLGIYEAQLGIAMAWSVLLIIIKRPGSWKRWLSLGLPLIIGVAFLLGKLFSYLFLGIGPQDYFSRFQLTPGLIVENFLRGFGVMLWAWLDPLTYGFGLAGWQAAGILLLLVTLCALLVYTAGTIFRKLGGRYLTQKQHESQLRGFMLILLVGPILIAAGYMPSIVFFRPTLFQLHSRLNLFPLMGAALTLVALLAVVVLIFSRKQRQINLMVFAATIPLIILGIMVQMRVQYDDRVAWEMQKQMWRDLFVLAPDFTRETKMILILPEDETQEPSFNRNGQRFPFAGGWDLGTGLNMLYGRYDLSGDLATKELFLKEGIQGSYSDKITPYEQVIVLAYDGTPQQLRLIEDLEIESLVDFPVPDYNPREHILDSPIANVEYRWLVGMETEKE